MCRYKQLDALKLKLDSFLPLPLEVVGNLRADLVLRWTYVYRKTNVIISGAEHVPPDAWRVQSDMESLISWCQGEGANLHPVERAARIHSDFVKIHPFVDGNGRTARLLMNLELMKSGFPPVVLHVKRRLQYYEALDKAHTNNGFESFLQLITEIVMAGFEPYWHALGVTG